MNGRLHSNRSERGIALVITLVMLAIVTVMAIVFLAVSRRERASVKVVEDIATANSIADAALERAKAEAIAKMAAEGTKLNYDLFNSRAFINPGGFKNQSVTSQADPMNVSYVDNGGNVLAGANYLRMLANLQYDPRVPVFVETNANGATDFRYFLDFNRNRLFETNGVVPVLDDSGRVIVQKGITNEVDVVGDPEWIGVLERPDYPHSETNRFIGRMAYLVLPAGKTLDLNYIHNQADPASPEVISPLRTGNGYTRNQGVGSWEINLAAFFRELNPTNGWDRNSYIYRPGSGQLPTGDAFDNARAFLAFRYATRRFLSDANFALSSNPENVGNKNIFDLDEVDNYGDGPLPRPGGQIFFRNQTLTQRENDKPTLNWPGSFSTNAFTDLGQVFNIASGNFTNHLQAPMRRKGTSDRYQFYRMAAQMGVDSTPSVKNKLHLNFVNAPGKITNTFVPWTSSDPKLSSPIKFFTNAVDALLKASIDRVLTISNRNQVLTYGRQPGTYYMIGDTLVSTNFSLTNIQVYTPPFNTNFPSLRQSEYSPAVHRLLQVAVNIYDSMTNRGPALDSKSTVYYPTVLSPVFTKTSSNVFISGWTEVTNVGQVLQPSMDLAEFYRTNRYPAGRSYSNIVLYGQHLIIGAKKGHLNFNELAVQTSAEVARKLEVAKTSAGGNPSQTNQMFLVNLAQRWGMEAWNSYTNKFDRSVGIKGDILSTIAVKDGTNAYQAPLQIWNMPINGKTITTNNWAGVAGIVGPQTLNFSTILSNEFTLLPDVAYTKLNGFRNTNVALFTKLEPVPHLVVSTTNKVRYVMWDDATKRVLDYVSFDNLVTTTDIGSQLYAPPGTSSTIVGGGQRTDGNNEDIYWDPTPVGNLPGLTRGITNQLAAAAGDIEVDVNIWKAFRFSDPVRKADDKNGAIAVWRKFLGLPLLAGMKDVGPLPDLRRQIPFIPSRRIEQLISWQVNDPLVHYMAQDIAPVPGTDTPRKIPITTPPGPTAWNIGRLNVPGYRPWGGSPVQQATGTTGDATAYSVAVKDAAILKSDDWEFPINERAGKVNHFFGNIGELGRVHRGTPWQTLYLKSIYTMQNTATGVVAVPLPGSHPTDWRKWAGSTGTHPMYDWRLMDIFTTAPNENATRGLLSVNQTNSAAWSAVLSGVIVPTNTIKNAEARTYADHEGADPTSAYEATYIEPATPQIAAIVGGINFARQKQLEIIPNPNIAANPSLPWDFAIRKNTITGKTNVVFERLGEILLAPQLTVQSPFLNTANADQVKRVITDRAIEYIPEKIMSLLQRDEPRFVVYAFGQSLKPAQKSLTSDPNFYHMCTNYQITGEVTTKTVFRVEGELPEPNNPFTQNKPLHAVVESYEILPPVE